MGSDGFTIGCLGTPDLRKTLSLMGNHELSPLDAICVAPVYTAAWAQEHASSETCLMASSYRKSVHYSG